MTPGSRVVQSSQTGLHPNLEQVVSAHLQHCWRKPVAGHTRQAFAHACQWREEQGKAAPLILDSGCGTGRSSVRLANASPDALVIGLDQSASRLQTSLEEPLPANLLLLRAEAADFWRLALSERWRLAAHYLLYPNPWPKPAHLRRRWHGHPVFPVLLALGGRLELRSNWRLYVEEFAAALAVAGHNGACIPLPRTGTPLSDFEGKYAVSGHSLYHLVTQLG